MSSPTTNFRDHIGRDSLYDHRVGAPLDRNVELLLPTPFPLQTAEPPELLRPGVPAGPRP